MQAERGVGAEVLPRARRVVVGDGDLIPARALGARPHVGREDVAVDDSLPVGGPVDVEVDASRMVIGLEEGTSRNQPRKDCRSNVGSDVDQAREPARVEGGSAGREDGRPILGPPSRSRRSVEADLPDDRGSVSRNGAILPSRSSGFTWIWFFSLGFPGKRHSLRCKCHSVSVVQAISWPGATTCPSWTTGSTCPYVKWPIRTMPSLVGLFGWISFHTGPPSSA